MDLKDLAALAQDKQLTDSALSAIKEHIKATQPARDVIRDTVEKYRSSMDVMRESIQGGQSALVEAARRASESSAMVRAREAMKLALDQSSLASMNVKGLLADLPQSMIPKDLPGLDPSKFDMFPRYEAPELLLPDFVEPIGSETNRELRNLQDQISALIEISKEQAKLTQAIQESTEATAKLAMQSSEDAKASTALASTSIELTRASVRIAKNALIVTIIIGALSVLAGLGQIYIVYHPPAAPVAEKKAAPAAPPPALTAPTQTVPQAH